MVQSDAGHAEPGVTATPRPLILLVEDYADTRDLYVYYLTRHGYRTSEAADGYEALRQVAEAPPDLILMDLSLPGLDGWEVTRRLKQDPRTAHIPIVVLSAHVRSDEQQRAWDAGCDAFVAKPCLPKALAGEIARVLRTH